MARSKQSKGIIERRRADGSVVYEVTGRLGAKVRRIGTYESRAEAERAEQERQVEHRKIRRGELPPEHDSRRTLDEGVAEWLGGLLRRKSRSHRSYSKYYELYIAPRLGKKTRVTSVRRSHVMAMRDDLAVHFSASTVNGAITCLSSAFTYFGKRGWVEANPCRGVEYAECPERDYVWIRTKQEITRMLAACATQLRPIVATAVLTGMRIDEILHLQWVDVDLERRLITVHRGRQGTVKSGKLRRVPILDALLPVLRDWKLQSAGSVLVFPGAANHPLRRTTDRRAPVRSKQSVTRTFKLALRRSQLDEAMRFHDLRHTFASHWMMDGGDIFKLSKILGHSSVRITEKTYAHLAPTAFEPDYGRLAIHVPTEPAKIYDIERHADGRIRTMRAVVMEADADESAG